MTSTKKREKSLTESTKIPSEKSAVRELYWSAIEVERSPLETLNRTIQTGERESFCEQEEWTALFRMEATKNYLSSVTFLKKLTIIALSAITYARNMFPENSYVTQSFAGIKLKVLKETSKCELATFISTSLTASFDALEKKYLKQLAVCVYEDERRPETLLECYVFTYRYNEQDVSISLHREDNTGAPLCAKTFTCTMETIKKSTQQLLRTCIVTLQSVDILPTKYDLSLRLYYYDEITPVDYHPEGFAGDSREDQVMVLRRSGLIMGEVSTPYHKMDLRISRPSYQDDHADDTRAVTLKDTIEEIANVDGVEIQSASSSATVLLDASNISVAPEEADNPSRTISDAVGEEVEHSVGDSVGDTTASRDLWRDRHDFGDGVGSSVVKSYEDVVFQCPCNKTNEPNNLIDSQLIICRECGTSQHLVCFGLQPCDSEALLNHVCVECALVHPTLVCTDPRLLTMEQWQRESYCVYRRVLWLCSQLQYITVQTLADSLLVQLNVATKVMRRLEMHGAVQPLPKGRENGTLITRTINLRKLKREVFPRFFITSEPTLPTSQNEKFEQYLLSPEEQMYDIEKRIKENINLEDNTNFGSNIERNMQISSNPENNFNSITMEIEPEQVITKKKTNKLGQKFVEKKDSNMLALKKIDKTKRKIESDVRVEPRPKRKCSAKTKRSF